MILDMFGLFKTGSSTLIILNLIDDNVFFLPIMAEIAFPPRGI
ncbi:MAG: hypothetical protein ACFC1C_03860 [Candidatus Malihini olakiniferum]